MEAVLFQPMKNKIFRMLSTENRIDVEFGHIGNKLYKKSYPLSVWDEIYQEKIKCGYVDQTGLLNNNNVVTLKLSQTESINEVLENLRAISRQMISDNYRGNMVNVSEEAINKSKELLKKLEITENVYDFNSILFELFSMIPRKMNNVIQNTAKDQDDFYKIIERENDLLRNLQVLKTDSVSPDIPIICRECTSDEITKIRSMLDTSSLRKFKRAWSVNNPEIDQKFSSYMKKNNIKKTRELFHGSRSENWWSILTTKLLLQPSNVVKSGAMFGRGIYFADKADKSMGYTSIRDSRHAAGKSDKGYLAIYEVATGHEYDVKIWKSSMTDLNESSFIREHKDCNSLHAHAGVNLINDEYIVYNENACRIKYFLEFAL
jgi:poly [ADP-ribose] polymerase